MGFLRASIVSLAMICGSFVLISYPASAARLGVIDPSKASVLEEPKKDSRVLEDLKKGDRVAASNFPLQGYHKIRTAAGTVGWIEENSLVLQPIPPADPDDAEDPAVAKADPLKKKIVDKVVKQHVRIKLLAGADFFNMNTVVNHFSLGQAIYFGGELTVLFTPGFGLVLRAEKTLQSLNLTNGSSGYVYQTSLSSIPLMGGFEVGLLGETFSAHFALLGGVGLQSYVQVIGASDATNALIASPAPLTAIFRIDFTWQISRYFGLFIEGGYRYLYAGNITTQGSAPIALPMAAFDMRGGFGGGGVSVGF